MCIAYIYIYICNVPPRRVGRHDEAPPGRVVDLLRKRQLIIIMHDILEYR